MHLSFALNTIFGSALILALVFANYMRKYNTDRFQRLVFGCLLIFSFIAMACDMIFMLIEELPGRGIFTLTWGICTAYYLFQVLAYYYIMVFVDYMVFKSPERTKKITVIVYMITIIHIIILVTNIREHFYFYIEAASNRFFRGDKYYSRIFFAFSPILFAVWDLISSRKIFKRAHLFMMFLLVGLSFLGAIMDMIFSTARLVWPCITATLLYSYFFIIQSDTRIDSLTGIGNRFSFNEFTDKLSRHNSGESWAIVMIDMDHFKRINDTLGHQEGDNALRDMSAIIKNCVRGSDFAARYGGDEFVLATKVEKGNESGILKLMGDIQVAVDQHNAKNTRPFKLEISYGYDIYTADGKQPIENFLIHIDSLMYKHKQERRRASDKKNEAAI
jgi:diguanylate cyclase (GGDEF)-like protein